MSVPLDPARPSEPTDRAGSAQPTKSPVRDSVPLHTDYAVATASPQTLSVETVERAAVQPARPLHAVFVTHGMGQQIPFQTLDQIAEGLLAEYGVRHPQGPPAQRRAASVELGEEKERHAAHRASTRADGGPGV